MTEESKAEDNIDIDRYAVFGNPIEHSKSPQIHSLFAKQTNQQISYTAVLVLPDQFEQAVGSFARSGGRGLNITVPFKIDALDVANTRSERAERAGAANTLIINGADDYTADNTDGVGLIRDLKDNLDITLKDTSILILGAGGATRGVIQPILSEKPKILTIANRTAEKANTLEDLFSDLGSISGVGLDQLDGLKPDIIINATSASLSGEIPDIPKSLVSKHTICYDMMYSAEPTVFMRWATECDARIVSDGLGMLVEQAAESFFLWRGVRPSTAQVIQQIRNTL